MKTQAVRDFVNEHSERLRLVFLPTYSLWLNPIELFWHHLKRRVLANRFFDNMTAQLRELWKRFKALAADGPQVRLLIGAYAS